MQKCRRNPDINQWSTGRNVTSTLNTINTTVQQNSTSRVNLSNEQVITISHLLNNLTTIWTLQIISRFNAINTHAKIPKALRAAQWLPFHPYNCIKALNNV